MENCREYHFPAFGRGLYGWRSPRHAHGYADPRSGSRKLIGLLCLLRLFELRTNALLAPIAKACLLVCSAAAAARAAIPGVRQAP